MIRLLSENYDDGSPYYMSVINQWTDVRQPVWRFKCVADSPDEYDQLANWIVNSATYGYDYNYRFNDGNPYLTVEFIHESDAVAFKLRFTDF